MFHFVFVFSKIDGLYRLSGWTTGVIYIQKKTEKGKRSKSKSMKVLSDDEEEESSCSDLQDSDHSYMEDRSSDIKKAMAPTSAFKKSTKKRSLSPIEVGYIGSRRQSRRLKSLGSEKEKTREQVQVQVFKSMTLRELKLEVCFWDFIFQDLTRKNRNLIFVHDSLWIV